MLEITVKTSEKFDEETQEFVTTEFTLEMEHSLVSLSKWESIWEKPFLVPNEKTPEELLSYYECMIITKNPPEGIVECISEENLLQIDAYVNKKMTATWFSETKNPPKSRQTITSELIYSWMVGYNISFECQHWHLNRLLTLVRILDSQNQKPKKMSASEALAQRQALNAQRKAKYNTSG